MKYTIMIFLIFYTIWTFLYLAKIEDATIYLGQIIAIGFIYLIIALEEMDTKK